MKVTLTYEKPGEEQPGAWGETIEIERDKQSKDDMLVITVDRYLHFRLDHAQVTELIAALELVG
jgi:hypothetical protein